MSSTNAMIREMYDDGEDEVTSKFSPAPDEITSNGYHKRLVSLSVFFRELFGLRIGSFFLPEE